MKIRNRINLIPRNNWDYGFDALFSGLRSIFRHTTQSPNIENIFHQNPIWTRSGRVSLYAILRALDLPPGAKVGVPLFCCSVVFEAICQAGLSPHFIDSNRDDFNISTDDLRKKRSNLAAVVAVHMFGNPFDFDAINAVADGIPVIEDCAQSIFSTYNQKLTGLLSAASFFSFRCGKYISAGEGSAIFCKDRDLRQKIERIVDTFEIWSIPRVSFDVLTTFIKAKLYNRPWYGLIGFPIGMRLDKKLNLTAKDGFEIGKIAPTHLSLIDSRVDRFREKITKQREHAHMLLDVLEPGNFGLLSETDGCSSNWHQFALRFESVDQRDTMAEYLFQQGIDTAKYLDDITDEARSKYGYIGDCPTAELLSKTVLLVPIHYSLNTGDIEHIAQSIKEGSQTI